MKYMIAVMHALTGMIMHSRGQGVTKIPQSDLNKGVADHGSCPPSFGCLCPEPIGATNRCVYECSGLSTSVLLKIDCSNRMFDVIPTSLPTPTVCDLPLGRGVNGTDCDTTLMQLYLSLQYNNITVLTSRQYFGQLTVLDLSFNQIYFLNGDAILIMTSLIVLRLNDNKLSSLSSNVCLYFMELGQSQQLRTLSLENNPWNCSCASVIADVIDNATHDVVDTTNNKQYMTPFLKIMSTIINDNFTNVTCGADDISADLLTIQVILLDEQCDNAGKGEGNTDQGSKLLPVYAIAVITLVVVYIVLISAAAVCRTIRKRKPVAIEKYEIT